MSVEDNKLIAEFKERMGNTMSPDFILGQVMNVYFKSIESNQDMRMSEVLDDLSEVEDLEMIADFIEAVKPVVDNVLKSRE